MRKNKILKSVMKYMPLYVAMLLVMFAQRYIASLTALFIGEVLGTIAGEPTVLPSFLLTFINNTSISEKIISLTVLYIVISIINVIAVIFHRWLRIYHFEKLYMDLSKTYYEHVISISKSEYANRSTGDIIQRNIEDCKRIPALFKNALYTIFKIIFTTVTLLMQLYILNKTIFIVSLISVLICVSFSGYYGYFKVKKKELESSKNYSDLNSTIQQSIVNYSLVKSFANEDYEYEKFKEVNDRKEENNYYLNNLHCRYWLISDTITSIYVISCLITLAYLFFNGIANFAIVSAVAVISATFLNESTHLMDNITTVVRTFISVKRLNEYFNIESEFKIDGTSTNEIKGKISFKNVNMKYDDGHYVLKDVSFELKEGETLGIVGKSGSGKTSLVNLLTRLDEYESGSIQIDGIELKDYSKKWLRENIGVVLQDAYIFSKSIKENLLVLIDNDRIDLDMYLKRVGLDEDIAKFESGLETIVGERGVTLSGGQRQRLSLLRTIIKNKKILILDDTLSAVDNIVARKIKDSLNKEKATTIIISHNLLNIKDADKILVLDEGKIVGYGTHDELLKQEGFYSNVWNLQQMIQEVSQ